LTKTGKGKEFSRHSELKKKNVMLERTARERLSGTPLGSGAEAPRVLKRRGNVPRKRNWEKKKKKGCGGFTGRRCLYWRADLEIQTGERRKREGGRTGKKEIHEFEVGEQGSATAIKGGKRHAGRKKQAVVRGTLSLESKNIKKN